LAVFSGTPYLDIAAVGAATNAPPPPPSMPLPATSGNILNVGSGLQYSTLEAAITAASPGDTIQVAAGSYTGSSMVISENLTIIGIGNPTITFNGGTGPYIQLSGDNVNVSISNLNLVGLGVNTTIVGDTNIAYGPPLTGSNQTLHLINVSISNTAGAAIYAVKPTASYDIQGGAYSSTIAMVAGAQLSITPASGSGTQISTTSFPGSGIYMNSGFAAGSLSVSGATFLVTGQPAIILADSALGPVSNLAYVALVNNTFSGTSNRFDINSTDLTSAIPQPAAYFSIVSGAVVLFDTPASNTAHWLRL
jgi:hypothetical protein